MIPWPDRDGRELEVLILRTAGEPQDGVAGTLHMSKHKVRRIENWFKSLSDEDARRICDESEVRSIVNRRLDDPSTPPEDQWNDLSSGLQWRVRTLSARDILQHHDRISTQAAEDDEEGYNELWRLAETWRHELFVPSADLVLPPLGPGYHQINLAQTTAWRVTRVEDRAVILNTVAGEGGASETNGGTFHIEVALDGSPRLVCPAQHDSRFERLIDVLGEEIRSYVSDRSVLSTEYLVLPRSVQIKIREDARTQSGVAVFEPILSGVIKGFLSHVPGLSPPEQLLAEDFWKRIYQLAVVSKLRGEDMRPKVQNYTLIEKEQDVFMWELYLGDTHIATGFPMDIERWRHLHRDMIGEWASSWEVNKLIGLYELLLEMDRRIIGDLDRFLNSPRAFARKS